MLDEAISIHLNKAISIHLNKAISIHLNESISADQSECFQFASSANAALVIKFHESLPNYQATPLVKLKGLAKQLGLSSIQVKDESQRFDLNAFKGLGASFAMAKYLSRELGLAEEDYIFDKIHADKIRYQELTFVTATDGNHGRALAWSAEKFGCKSVVYMPKGSSLARLEAIRAYGAEAEITEYNYDDTVRLASKKAEENGWILLQDTAWLGYEDIPLDIMQGYLSLMSECQFKQEDWPTHVFVQAGVGSLPAAILAYLVCANDKPLPKFVVVEPNNAACLYASLEQGAAAKIEGELPTIMAGLACGEPSVLALEILKKGAYAFVKCDDEITRNGMKLMAKPIGADLKIVSGESGAVTLGLVNELLSNTQYLTQAQSLGLDSSSKVLLFSTEGDTDPGAYRDIIETAL